MKVYHGFVVGRGRRSVHLVKANTTGSAVPVCIRLPKEWIGKRMVVKVEVLQDENV